MTPHPSRPDKRYEVHFSPAMAARIAHGEVAQSDAEARLVDLIARLDTKSKPPASSESVLHALNAALSDPLFDMHAVVTIHTLDPTDTPPSWKRGPHVNLPYATGLMDQGALFTEKCWRMLAEHGYDFSGASEPHMQQSKGRHVPYMRGGENAPAALAIAMKGGGNPYDQRWISAPVREMLEFVGEIIGHTNGATTIEGLDAYQENIRIFLEHGVRFDGSPFEQKREEPMLSLRKAAEYVEQYKDTPHETFLYGMLDMMSRRWTEAETRWKAFEARADKSQTPEEDFRYFSNIDKLGEAFDPHVWQGKEIEAHGIISRMPPWMQEELLVQQQVFESIAGPDAITKVAEHHGQLTLASTHAKKT